MYISEIWFCVVGSLFFLQAPQHLIVTCSADFFHSVIYQGFIQGGGGRPGISSPPNNQITLECSVHVLITLEWL